eukprot:jgi/Tetstr1/453316/TSEL_040307.t1
MGAVAHASWDLYKSEEAEGVVVQPRDVVMRDHFKLRGVWKPAFGVWVAVPAGAAVVVAARRCDGAAGVRAPQRQHAPGAASAAHDATLVATARWCANRDVYRMMPRTPLRGTVLGVCRAGRLVLFPLLHRTLAYDDRLPPTDDRSYGAEGVVCVFAGLLLRPYPSSSPALVRKLAERRVRLWEAGDAMRAGFSVCGMQQRVWRE